MYDVIIMGNWAQRAWWRVLGWEFGEPPARTT
jgi:hypothetical protein